MSKQYLEKEQDEIRLKRAARAAGSFYVPSQAKVYFVMSESEGESCAILHELPLLTSWVVSTKSLLSLARFYSCYGCCKSTTVFL
jgi:hypothetical protein